MLGVERNRLANCKLTDFLAAESQDSWHLHRRDVFSDEAKKSCELAMNPAHGNSLTVRLESQPCEGAKICRKYGDSANGSQPTTAISTAKTPIPSVFQRFLTFTGLALRASPFAMNAAI